MKYTSNYQLPQWVKTDRIQMTDFNTAMSRIDTALTNNKTQAEEGIAQAKAAADTAAKAAADAATAAAVLPFVTGSYVGNLESTKFTLGFRPSFIIIFAVVDPCSESVDFSGLISCFTESQSYVLYFEDDGFTVRGNSYNYPRINWRRENYYYIAFR